MLRFVGLAPVGLLFLVVGCSDNTGPVSLTLNRSRWDQQNLHAYSYTSTRSCFFCPLSGQGVVVAVMADTVFSATVLATGIQLPNNEWNTVPQLFDLVQYAFGERNTSVKVDYHSELGYPTQIDVTCDDRASTADSESKQRISAVSAASTNRRNFQDPWSGSSFPG